MLKSNDIFSGTAKLTKCNLIEQLPQTINSMQKVLQLVTTVCFLHYTGTLNDKTHVLTRNDMDNNTVGATNDAIEPEGMGKVFKAVLSSHGPIVSFTVLNIKGLFRRHMVDNMTNRRLMQRTVNEMASLELGEIKSFTIAGNNSKVYQLT